MPVISRRTLAATTAVATLAGAGMALAASYPGYPSSPSTPTPPAATTPATTAAKAVRVSARLTPGQEVPRSRGSKGSGTFVASLSPRGKLTYTLSFKGLTGPPIGSHLHMGKPGTAGPIIVPLCTSPTTCKSPIKGSKTLPKSLIAAMRRGDAYVNVHTVKNPGGEIRGLIKVR
jgi:hypothetical protein